MPTRKNGTVKWFNPDKGYGFIKPEDGGPDVFVHVTELRAAGIKSLSEGERVSFELGEQQRQTSGGVASSCLTLNA